MKKSAYAILVCSTFLISLPSVALSRGVNINFVNDGKGVDMYALQSTRKIIGSAIAEGVVDTFMITPLKADAATPPKKGFSACIEAGVGGTPNAFDSLVKRLKFVHPKVGTTISVEVTESCKTALAPPTLMNQVTEPTKAPELITCGGATGKLCPDNLICIDDPRDSCDPMLGGTDCAGVCNGVPGKSALPTQGPTGLAR